MRLTSRADMMWEMDRANVAARRRLVTLAACVAILFALMTAAAVLLR